MIRRTFLSIKKAHRTRQSGNIVFTLFAAVGMVGIIGVTTMTAVKHPARVIGTITQKSVVENDMIAAGKLALNSIAHLPAGGDCDGDGMPEPPAWLAAGGAPAPTGGGLLPTDIGAAQMDAWQNRYGYCAWDFGAARIAGVCPSDNRLEGKDEPSGILVAIISAGPDKTFQTSCTNAAGGYVVRDNNSDDIVLTHSLSDARAMGGAGELWNIKSGQPDTAEIDKSLEVVNSGGTKVAGIDKETGIGEFGQLVTGAITGKSSGAVAIDGAIQLADETLATDGACNAGTVGTLRYHATNGMEICNGTAFVAVTGGDGGGYSYSGLYEGKISAGDTFTCGLRLDGTAWCWGTNANGQLGNGTTTNTNIPTPVTTAEKFIQISAGGNSTCALNTKGEAFCWGYNNFGQLGDGTTVQKTVPTLVVGGHKFVQVAMGNGNACGLRTDGNAYCWGSGGFGAMGNGTTAVHSNPTPQAVTGGHKFVQIHATNNGACGLRIDGAAYCWGWNSSGQLGSAPSGGTVFISSPVAVTGGHKFAQITMSDSATCGVRTDGKAYCWGSNTYGNIGDGTTGGETNVPTAVIGDHSFAKVKAALHGTCGIRTDGVTMCWGAATILGNGSGSHTGTPVVVSAGHTFTEMAGGGAMCGIGSNGAVYCWGSNFDGRLGDGTTTSRSIPTHVLGFSMVDVQKRPYKFAQDGIACGAGREGTVEYHSTNGLRLCNGASYGAVSTNTPFGQYDYNGLYEDRLSAGYEHMCALRADGQAYCWGANWSGQLGDGTTVAKSVATPVSGGHTFVQIESGAEHTCALKADGTAWCWGENAPGAIGDGTVVDKSVPTAVSGGHKFTQIEAGEYSSCGVRTDGLTYCWGGNVSGQLGDGSWTNRTVPVATSGGRKFIKFALGQSLACGIEESGQAYCWGYNEYYQVGDGTATDRNVPTAVAGGLSFVDIKPGMSTACGIVANGDGYCWGQNTDGQLGDGTTTNRTAPTLVTGGYKFTQLFPDTWHTCGLRNDGVALCWGQNTNGQLGDGTTTGRIVPTPVLGNGNFAQIAPGGFHTCGLRSSGSIQCWGANWSGEIGDGTTTDRSTPVPTLGISMMEMQNRSFQFANDSSTCSVGLAGTMRYTGGTPKYDYCNGTAWVAFAGPAATATWRQVSSGGGHNCALQSNGAAYCWGENGDGRVGDTTTVQKTIATAVAGGHIFRRIYGGNTLSCGIKDNGAAYCWGGNTAGQLGNGTTTNSATPVLVSGSHNFTEMAPRGNRACALKDNGAAYCWGQNQVGQLGDGTLVDKYVPTLVSGGHLFSTIGASPNSTCAIKDDGAAYCWGNNSNGQLGDGTITNSSTPVLVSGGHKFTKISLGWFHACGIKDDGAAYCWGQNTYGQLGDGANTNSSVPVLVSGGHKFTDISVGGMTHSCAIKDDGAAYCWGLNTYGQLGDSSTTNRNVPVLVGGGHKFRHITTGSGHVCGATEGGAIYCWGRNNTNQMGDATLTDRTSPVRISEP